MFRRLYISNYALIESVELTPGPGLTVITGETGAGKSILLGALSLLQGGRADARRIAANGRKTVVEGAFSTDVSGMRELLESHDLEWNDEELLLRREISSTGRSRAFVNDTPVSLQVMGEIAARLIDIHSQHHNLLIGDASFQLKVIDAIADNEAERTAYRDCYREYMKLHGRVAALKKRIAAGRENEEFIRFRLEHLHKLKPKAGEQAELERKQEILGDSAALSENLGIAVEALSGDGRSALGELRECRRVMQEVNTDLFEEPGEENGIMDRLESVMVELRDISDTLADWAARVHANPVLLDKIERRLQQIYEAQRRLKVADESGLLELQTTLESQLAAITGEDDELPALERELKELGASLKRCAEALTETRRRGADRFAEMLVETALPLAMPNIKFAVSLSAGKLTPEGRDVPSFLCSFNKNQELQSVSAVASGGEISRLMLCLKSIIAGRMELPVLVFDEVDTGVSGDVASRIGAMMRGIAASRQVIAITHLPQVATQGDVHYKVYKEDTADATHSHVLALEGEARVMETARMLSGAEVDEAAIQNARSLLKQKK
ncbi:MAG: DNA repair protein RecN [Muribaculaceae bacterium]|nr:DNA repair protein RecN [Muribaculaceae bacterium]